MNDKKEGWSFQNSSDRCIEFLHGSVSSMDDIVLQYNILNPFAHHTAFCYLKSYLYVYNFY